MFLHEYDFILKCDTSIGLQVELCPVFQGKVAVNERLFILY